MIFSPKIKIKTVNKASSSSVPKPKIITTLNTLHKNFPPNKTSKNFKISTDEIPTLDMNSSESTSVINDITKKNNSNTQNTFCKPKILSIVWVNESTNFKSENNYNVNESNSNFLNYNLGKESDDDESINLNENVMNSPQLSSFHIRKKSSYKEFEFDLSDVSQKIFSFDENSNLISNSIYNKDTSELKPDENINNVYKMNTCFTYANNKITKSTKCSTFRISNILKKTTNISNNNKCKKNKATNVIPNSTIIKKRNFAKKNVFSKFSKTVKPTY